MRIRLQALLRGTAIAAVMAAAISIAPGAARADEMGDAIVATLQGMLTNSALSNADRVQLAVALAGSDGDGASLVQTLNAIAASGSANLGAAIGSALGQAATQLTQSGNLQAAANLSSAVAAGGNSVTQTAFGAAAGNTQTAAGDFGGGGGGGLGPNPLAGSTGVTGRGRGGSGYGLGGSGGRGGFSDLVRIGPYQS